MKKITMILFCFLITLIIIGCQEKSAKVAILIYDQYDTFMAEYIKELTYRFDDNIQYEIKYSGKSQANQNRQFNDYLEKKYDLIILNTVDRLASGSLISKADQIDTPIIFINREPSNELLKSKNSYYVGANSVSMGILQAELIQKHHLEGKIIDKNNDLKYQTILLKGEQGHQDSENRTLKVIETLNTLGVEIDLLEIKVASWDRLTGYLETKKMFEHFENIDLIISNNDAMALGAIDYLKEINDYNLDNHLITSVYGVDATVDARLSIKQNELKGTIVNDYVAQVNYVTSLLKYLLFNEKQDDFEYNRFNRLDGYIYY